jgi:S1-C subfamily serine protease
MVSGDIIKSVDDKPVRNVNELVKEILKKKVGQKVKVDIIRDGKETTLEVTTSPQPDKLESGKEEEKETEEKLEEN